MDSMKTGAELILVDFVVMNEGFDAAERDTYENKEMPLAAQYGVKMKALLKSMNSAQVLAHKMLFA